jgi:hypothetical protein
MYHKVLVASMEVLKDVPVLGGFLAVVFAKFDNTTNLLLQITDFNLSVTDAIAVWDSIVRTIVSVGTLVLIIWRIKAVKNKSK